MQPTEAQIRRLSRLCHERLGNPRTFNVPDAHPGSLALCVIDAVQSSGGSASLAKVIARYRSYRTSQGGDPESDGAVGLLGTFHDLGSATMWARTIGTGEHTSSDPASPLKAAVIELAATALSDIELYSAADLREVAAYPDLMSTVQAAWAGAIGERSSATWRRLLVLVGVEGVQPDRVTIRFVASALGLPPAAVEPEFAADVIERTAACLSVPPAALDQAMWRWQRAR